MTKHDEKILSQFKESLVFKEGCYEVFLLWKENTKSLKDNYVPAERRSFGLEKRLLEDPEEAKLYQKICARWVSWRSISQSNSAHWWPSCLLSPSSCCHLRKARIVFDAFAKDSNGVSLKSCLEAGPAWQPDLCDILLCFLIKRIAVMGDIEKMYLQICLMRMIEIVIDICGGIWIVKLFPKLIEWFTFGVITSSFFAICTTHARIYQEVSQKLQRKYWRVLSYVDDSASCRDEVYEAMKLQKNAKELMMQAAFNLTKWSSNSLEL